uniref:Uncharacterized protein n=1 Tax=Steinernema glaseri TaxID=37863 RepID=A0A1I7YCL4_9BILA
MFSIAPGFIAHHDGRIRRVRVQLDISDVRGAAEEGVRRALRQLTCVSDTDPGTPISSTLPGVKTMYRGSAVAMEAFDDAAKTIQRAWRHYRGKEIQKMLDSLTTREEEEPKIASILRSNDVLIDRLESLRRSRAYETTIYEQIVNMPSANVNSYLERESRRPDSEKEVITPRERLLRTELEHRKNEAAKKIQKVMRLNVRRVQEARTKERWTEFEGPKRVELLGKVAERLGGKYVLRRTDLETVRFKIASKDLNLDSDVSEFARRKRLIEALKTNMDTLKEIKSISMLIERGESLSKTPLGGHRGVARGQQLFEQKMEQLEIENLKDEFKDLR